MVESAADCSEEDEVSNVATDIEVGGKGHNVDIRHCRNEGDVEGLAQSARKMKSVHRDETVVVDAPMDVDVADAVPEGKSITEDKEDIGRATEAPVLARSRSL